MNAAQERQILTGQTRGRKTALLQISLHSVAISTISGVRQFSAAYRIAPRAAAGHRAVMRRKSPCKTCFARISSPDKPIAAKFSLTLLGVRGKCF